jgi:hypothetical protein
VRAGRLTAPIDFVLSGGPRSWWPDVRQVDWLCVPRPGWLLGVSWRVGPSRAFPAGHCPSATRTSFVTSALDEPAAAGLRPAPVSPGTRPARCSKPRLPGPTFIARRRGPSTLSGRPPDARDNPLRKVNTQPSGNRIHQAYHRLGAADEPGRLSGWPAQIIHYRVHRQRDSA